MRASDLYVCEIPDGAPAPVGAANPCASLIRVSGIAASARVESVAAVSDDGSQVYFAARGVLADNLGTKDTAPVDGELNLYLWTKDAAHPAGQVRFVAELAGRRRLATRSRPPMAAIWCSRRRAGW